MPSNALTRRALLRRTIQVGPALAGMALLAACGGSAATTVTTATSSVPAATSSTAPSTAASSASVASTASSASSVAATSTAATSSTASASSAAATTAAAATSSAAPATTARVAAGGTKVTMLTHWDPATTLKDFQPFVTEYAQTHPGVTVEVNAVSYDQLLQKITVAQTSGSIYDIYHIYDLWLAQLVRNTSLAAAPGDVATAIKDAYPPSAVDGSSSQGHVYGFPTEIDTYALNYNKRLFQEAGVADAPKTWADLEAAARKLTKTDATGAITQQGFGLITGWDAGVVHPWLSMLWSDGGEFLAPDFKQAAFNSTAGLDALGLYQRLINEKLTDPKLSASYSTNFINEKTAMIVMANWWQSTLQSKMKDNYADVATAPIPIGPAGQKSIAASYSWLFAVDRTSKQQPDAWQFLEWVNGPAAAGKSSRMGDWLLAQGILPSRTSDQQAHTDKLGTPFLKTYVDALQTARPFPNVLDGAEITTDMQKQIETVVKSGGDAKAALSNAETQINALLKKDYG
jgi:multiple sugar transport system substrate-binding protein